MKKASLALIVIMESCLVTAQPPLGREEYLHKSSVQKTTGYVFLGLGAAALVPGIGLLSKADPGYSGYGDLPERLGGTLLTFFGSACLVVSLSQFTASRKNKERGMDISLKLKEPLLMNTGIKTDLSWSAGIKITIK